MGSDFRIKIDTGSFSHFIKPTTLCDDQVGNIQDFHKKITISLNATAKTRIEDLPPLFDLEHQVPFGYLFLHPLIEVSIYPAFIPTNTLEATSTHF